jgi:hypothetical protein
MEECLIKNIEKSDRLHKKDRAQAYSIGLKCKKQERFLEPEG